MKKSIIQSEMPTKLKNVIINLHTGNFSFIDLGFRRTKLIEINRGVFQGAPLSPLLFNLVINYMFNELSDADVS